MMRASHLPPHPQHKTLSTCIPAPCPPHAPRSPKPLRSSKRLSNPNPLNATISWKLTMPTKWKLIPSPPPPLPNLHCPLPSPPQETSVRPCLQALASPRLLVTVRQPPFFNPSRLTINKGKKKARDAEDLEALSPKPLEMDTTPPVYGQNGAPSTPPDLGPSGSGTPTDEPPSATVSVTPNTATQTAGGVPATPIKPSTPPANNTTANITIYHQIGQPNLTGTNPIPPATIAVAPEVEPLQQVEDFSPPAKYELVLRPEGGFPEIKGHTHKTIRAHLDPATIKLWDKQEGPGVVAFSPSDNGTIDSAKVITFRDMLRDSLDAPDLYVIVPDINRSEYTEHRPVTPYYIGGITRFQKRQLLFWDCWATPKTAFFILPKGNFVTDYIMTLENTFLDDDDASVVKVTSALMSTIMANETDTFEDFIDEHHDAVPSHFTTGDIMDTIVGRMEVVPFQIVERGATITLFNIYAPSPTNNADAHAEWIALFRDRTYEFYGTANAMYPYTCGTCYSQDHPSGKCPFLDLPGWHKPTANTSNYDKPINMNGKGAPGHGPQFANRGGSRGSRGRGGRGGGNRGRGGQNRGRARGGSRGGRI